MGIYIDVSVVHIYVYTYICNFYVARMYFLSRLNERVLFLVNNWINLIKDLESPFPFLRKFLNWSRSIEVLALTRHIS